MPIQPAAIIEGTRIRLNRAVSDIGAGAGSTGIEIPAGAIGRISEVNPADADYIHAVVIFEAPHISLEDWNNGLHIYRAEYGEGLVTWADFDPA